MALKQADKDKLKALGITDVDALINAIKAEAEVDYMVPEGKIYTDAELTTRDTNTGATRHAEGEKAARGVLVTELGKRIPGLTLKGERIGDLVTEITTFMQASATDQVKQLQQQNQALIADKTALETQVTESRTKAERIEFETGLMDLFPQNTTKDLTPRERLTLIQAGMTFEKGTDGQIIVKKGGVIVADDKTRAPLPASKVLEGYFTERGWIAKDNGSNGGGPANKGGRGGNGSDPGGGGSGIKTMSQAKTAWKEANPDKDVNGPEFIKHVNAIAKADATFDYNQ